MNCRGNLTNDTSVGKGATAFRVQQNRVPKRASLVTASSAQGSSRHLLGPCLFVTTWLETYVMDQSILHFFNGQAGVTCKGFHSLANVKI